MLQKVKDYLKKNNIGEKLRKFLRRLGILFLILLNVAIIVSFYFILFPSPSFTPPITDESGLAVTGSIASLERVSIGGISQWISIRGWNKDNPILLYLHGSPGVATMPLNRIYNSDLEKRFIVVSWDQRGAGKSFSDSIPKESMTREQLVSDTKELVLELKNRFGKEKIFLVGFGFGSSIGMEVVKNDPASFYSFVAVSPFVSARRSEEFKYNYFSELSKKEGMSWMGDIVNKIKPPVDGVFGTIKDFTDENWLIFKMGGGLKRSTSQNFFLWKSMNSPEYGNYYDLSNWLKGMTFSLNSMYFGAMKNVELPDETKKLEVPLYFFLGKYDMMEPAKIAEEYFGNIEAPNKRLVWFDDSAHWPQYEESQKYNTEMFKVLEENYR